MEWHWWMSNHHAIWFWFEPKHANILKTEYSWENSQSQRFVGMYGGQLDMLQMYVWSMTIPSLWLYVPNIIISSFSWYQSAYAMHMASLVLHVFNVRFFFLSIFDLLLARLLFLSIFFWFANCNSFTRDSQLFCIQMKHYPRRNSFDIKYIH